MGFFKKMNDKYETDKNRESIFFPLSDYVEPEHPLYPLDVEVATPAYIVLEKLPSGDTVRLDFKCDSETNRVLSQFVMDKPKTAAPSLPENASVSVSSDPYEELKKLKELLDMGIVTQEEFDQKKSELLNL